MHKIVRCLSLFFCAVLLQHSRASDGGKAVPLICRFQHPDAVSSVLFWPKKKSLVTGCWDGSIRSWDFGTGKVTNEWKAHKQEVTGLALTHEGILASGGCDHVVRVWKGLTGTKLKELKTDAPCNSLAFSADGTLLCCTTTTDKCYLWDWSRDRLMLERELAVATAVKFSPTGNLAIAKEMGIVMVVDDACGGLTTKPLLLDKTKRDEFGYTLDGYWIWSLAFSPDGRTLAAFGAISDLILWEVLTGKQRRRLKTEEAIGFSVAFAPNGNILATGEGWQFRLRGFPNPYYTTSSSSKRDADCARLWDIRTGKAICRLEGHKEGTRCVAFSEGGKLLATGSEDKTAAVWDLSAFIKDTPRSGPEAPLGDLQSHWANLTGDNATLAFDSILAMSASPKQSLPYLRNKLRPLFAVENTAVEKLLKDLDSDDFRTRQHASEELSKLGEGAERVLHEGLSKEVSSEARTRIETLIEKWKGHNPPAEIVGALRGIEVLERIGSDGAARLLEDLAKGVPSARQTQDAKASLERIRERRK